MFSTETKLLLSRLSSNDLKKIKYIFIMTLLLSVTFYSWLFWTIFRDRIKDENFIGEGKCPACYGKSLCSLIDDKTLSLKGWSKYSPLDIVNVKNVHTAILKGNPIILKKLARPSELKNLDQTICEKSQQELGCDVTKAILKLPMVTARELYVHLMKGMSDLLRCPSQRLIGIMKEKFQEDANKKFGRMLSLYGKAHLATTLLLNPEPLLMQMFPRKEGWPFPNYLGACGRVIGVEDSGPPLTDFYQSPWEERVDYAYQILAIAEQLTTNDLGFSLYWTDLSYDNLAVNKKGKVVVVDLENLIVVDKSKIHREKQAGWDEPYYSPFDECPRGEASCVSFSVNDLCTRYTSDFNYYTACRNILSQYADEEARPGGFLHHLPAHIDSTLRPLLSECARPQTPGGRLPAKDKLLKELRNIRNDYL